MGRQKTCAFRTSTGKDRLIESNFRRRKTYVFVCWFEATSERHEPLYPRWPLIHAIIASFAFCRGLGLLGLLQTFPKGWGAFLLRGERSFHWGSAGWRCRYQHDHPVRASLFGWMWSFDDLWQNGCHKVCLMGLLIKDFSQNPVMFLDKTHSRQFKVFLQCSFASLSRSYNHQILKFRLGSDLGVKQIRYNQIASF